ncbi:DUF4436 family protein [Williamsia sp.]|uniref:DUF4436 family protein n=1 Tax=Williamsia sp. TaxID=1872085 RepID=UPI002F946765
MARAVRRSTLLTTLAIVAGLLVVYIAVLVLYALSGSDDHPDDRSPSADGVLVYLDVDTVEGSEYSLGGHVSVYPGSNLLNADGTLEEDLFIDVAPMIADQQLEFAAGTRPGVRPVSLYTYGDIRTWPFDHYSTESVSIRGFSEVDDVQIPLETEVAVTDSLTGWDIDAGDDKTGDGQAVSIEASRSAGSVIFDLALCVMLVVLPVCTLFVAIQTVRRRKAFQPPMVTWFAVMLFAVLPLRNIFPGAPPFGSWVDYTVVLWVVAGLVTAMALYVFAWWRQAP